MREELGETDRNGKLAAPIAGLVNWAGAKGNGLTRPAMEAVLGIDKDALLPVFHSKKATDLAKGAPTADPAGPAFGKKKAVIYATCFAEYNQPSTATAALAVLARQGVEAKLVYPQCCGCPSWKPATWPRWRTTPSRWPQPSPPWIADGYDVITLTASCGLMMKFEWPLILPENEAVRALSAATRISASTLSGSPRPTAWPTASPPSKAMSPCITPATPGRRTWAPSPPRCCG